jgi:hypothetical protein
MGTMLGEFRCKSLQNLFQLMDNLKMKKQVKIRKLKKKQVWEKEVFI